MYETLAAAVRQLDAWQRHVADLNAMVPLVTAGATAFVQVTGLPNPVPLRNAAALNLIDAEARRIEKDAARLKAKLDAAELAVG